MPRPYRKICEQCEENETDRNNNSVDLTNRKIYLFDLMEERTGVMISQAFAHWRTEDAKLLDSQPVRSVEFIINCPGGFMEIVTGIIAEITNPTNKFKINANVVSIAYSAAALLLLYIPVNNVCMYSNGHVMFHYSSWSSPVELNIMEHKRDAETQEKIFNSLLSKGLCRTKLTTEELTPLMLIGDAYFDASDCLKANIVGEIYG